MSTLGAGKAIESGQPSPQATAVEICPTGPVVGQISPPGSKSLTNRALVLAAMARGVSQLSGVLDSEDTHVMLEAWKKLGIRVERDQDQSDCLTVFGCGGVVPEQQADLYIANSGTTIRFLTAALAAAHGEFQLSGVPRMHQRPIGDLLQALRQLGAEVISLNNQRNDCPPVHIKARGLAGGTTRVAGNISSQFLSGLMMAAPLARSSVHLEVEGELVSVPYVTMTARVMQAFGANVEGPVTGPMRIEPTGYTGCQYSIEPDASAASYFWAAAAITGGDVTVNGLNSTSLQGDVRFCRVLAQMGCEIIEQPNSLRLIGKKLRGVDVDMSDISDTVQTLAAVALFAEGATRVRGVAHNRHKETDRIADLARELRKTSAEVFEHDDGLTIHPPDWAALANQSTTHDRWLMETYGDHRMAMSLALIGLRRAGIVILNPACTGKTYPEYWRDLAQLTQARMIEFGA